MASIVRRPFSPFSCISYAQFSVAICCCSYSIIHECVIKCVHHHQSDAFTFDSSFHLLFGNCILLYFLWSVDQPEKNEKIDATNSKTREYRNRRECHFDCICSVLSLIVGHPLTIQPKTERLSSFTECAGKKKSERVECIQSSRARVRDYSHLSFRMFLPAWFPSIRSVHRSQLVACDCHW